jgi:type IV pilus assembly protein PilA
MLKKLIKKFNKTKAGFTLIELIVVIAILAILAVVLIPLVSGQIGKARDSKAKSDLNSAYLACQMAFTNDIEAGSTFTVGNAADQTTVITDAAKYYTGTISAVTFTGDDDSEATGIKSVTITENGNTYVYDPTSANPFTKNGTAF